jgi:hypothetical protein
MVLMQRKPCGCRRLQLRSGARRTSGGEAAAGHTGSTEGAGDSNHGEGVGLRVEMNWVMRRWMEGDGGSCD